MMTFQSLTVHEMFGRHLIQLPGLSAEKAAVILKHYPTLSQYENNLNHNSKICPRYIYIFQCSLREAYSSCANEADKVKLMENLRSGPSNRYTKYCTVVCAL